MKNPLDNLLFRFIDRSCLGAFRYHGLDLLLSYRVTGGAFNFENGKKKIAQKIQKPHDRVSHLCEYPHGPRNDLCDFFRFQQTNSLWDQFAKYDREIKGEKTHNSFSPGKLESRCCVEG